MGNIESTASSQNFGRKVFNGAIWSVGMRWLSRLIGLLSMIVITRLLTPADFGIIAVTSAVVALLDAFTDVGSEAAVIRHPKPEAPHYNTAWTFNILIHLFSAAIILLIGKFSAYLYSDPRYEMILYVMSLSMLVSGFTNIGIVNFRRELKYHKDFIYIVTIQLIGALSTVGIAFWLHSYWALALSSLVRSIMMVLLSFLMQSYRPKISLECYREMFGFSFWVMLRSIAVFLTNKADRLILASHFSTASLGLYAIAGDLANMVVFELLFPISRALFPALAIKQHDKAWLKENLKKIFNITATMAVVTSVGLASIAEPALTLIYGQSYAQAAPMLAILALLNGISGFNQPVGQFLLLQGKAKDFALLYMLEGIITLFVIYLLAVNGYGFITIIHARLGIGCLAFLRLLLLLKTLNEITLFDVIAAWVRPILAGAAMYFSVIFFQAETIHLSTIAVFCLSILIGGLACSSVLFCLWLMMKKPAGFEDEFFRRLGLFSYKRYS